MNYKKVRIRIDRHCLFRVNKEAMESVRHSEQFKLAVFHRVISYSFFFVQVKPFDTCEDKDVEEENESENTNCTNSKTQKSPSTACCSLSSASSSSSNYNLYAISVSFMIFYSFGQII